MWTRKEENKAITLTTPREKDIKTPSVTELTKALMDRRESPPKQESWDTPPNLSSLKYTEIRSKAVRNWCPIPLLKNELPVQLAACTTISANGPACSTLCYSFITR